MGPLLKRFFLRCVTVTAAAGFLLLVPMTIVALLGHRPTEEEGRVLVLTVPVGGAMLFLYLRMRGDIHRFARHLVYGKASSTAPLLESMKDWVQARVPLEDLLMDLVASLRRELNLLAAEVWTVSEGGLQRQCSSPERGRARVPLAEVEERAMASTEVAGPTRLKMWVPRLLAEREGGALRAAPVRHSGRLEGLVIAERAPGGEPFDADDESVLVDVARELGLIVALEASFDELRRRAEELQHSRARLVAAADEARRQIERNLHDGAQNQLIVILGTLRQAVDRLAPTDAPTVRTLIEEASQALEDSVQELRDLAHGVYPPVLADRGLAEALRSAGRRMKLPVQVEAHDVKRLDVGLETAVYFCCLEALQNVKKHAGDGATVDVRLCSEPGKFHFEVMDDGRGFEPETSGGGAGLTNMRDRLEAVGGRLVVHASPGEGCAVRGEIPIDAQASAREGPSRHA